MNTIYLKTVLPLLVATSLFSQELKPLIRLETSGYINDFIIDDTKVYAATTEGKVEIFDIYKKEKVGEIVFPLVSSGRGEAVVVRVLSIDKLQNRLLLVTSASKGKKDIWIYTEGGLKRVAQKSADALVKKAQFIDEDHYLFATFASEAILYAQGENYEQYHRQLTQSRLSDMVMSEDKKRMVMADESGEVRLIEVNSSKEIALVGALNVDNIYKIAYKNGTILTGGQDRRVGVYGKGIAPYYLKSDFLVYCVGLCADGGMGAYSRGFDHDIQIFEIKTKKERYRLVGHNSVINKIVFFTETIIVSAGDAEEILIWQLPAGH